MFAALALAVMMAAAPLSESAWGDWRDGDRPDAWYRLKPSFPEQGPWVLVRFYARKDPSRRWTAIRTSMYFESDDPKIEPRIVTEVTDSQVCPAIGDVIGRLPEALSVRLETDPRRWKSDLPPMNDGVDVTVGAAGRLEGGDALAETTVTGNVDTPSAAWAFEAEDRLRSCWSAETP